MFGVWYSWFVDQKSAVQEPKHCLIRDFSLRQSREIMLSSAVGSRPSSMAACHNNPMAASASPSSTASSSSAMSVAQTADLWLKIDQGWNRSNVDKSNNLTYNYNLKLFRAITEATVSCVFCIIFSTGWPSLVDFGLVCSSAHLILLGQGKIA